MPPPQKAAKDAEEGWTLVTQRKKPYKQLDAPTMIFGRRQPKRKTGGKHRKASPKKVVQKSGHKKRRPVTLAEFFPKDFLSGAPAMVATCSQLPCDASARKDKGKAPMVECDDLETMLKQVSPGNEIQDDLDLSIRSREALINVLADSEKIKAEMEQLMLRKNDEPKVTLTPPFRKEQEDALSNEHRKLDSNATTCPPCISFKEEDLQLKGRMHNRPLFVPGFIRECPVNRILIDCGSAVNILPIQTMKNIGLQASDLASSSLMIQGSYDSSCTLAS